MTTPKQMTGKNHSRPDDLKPEKNCLDSPAESQARQRYEAILELKRVTEHNRANYARRNKWADVAKCDDILQKLDELLAVLRSVILKDS